MLAIHVVQAQGAAEFAHFGQVFVLDSSVIVPRAKQELQAVGSSEFAHGTQAALFNSSVIANVKQSLHAPGFLLLPHNKQLSSLVQSLTPEVRQ